MLFLAGCSNSATESRPVELQSARLHQESVFYVLESLGIEIDREEELTEEQLAEALGFAIDKAYIRGFADGKISEGQAWHQARKETPWRSYSTGMYQAIFGGTNGRIDTDVEYDAYEWVSEVLTSFDDYQQELSDGGMSDSTDTIIQEVYDRLWAEDDGHGGVSDWGERSKAILEDARPR